MRQSNDRDKKTVKEKLEQNFDLPSDLLYGGCYLEIRGRGNAVIGGCRKILVYSPDEIRLEMKSCELVLRGKRLICTSYCESAVVIDGIIDTVEYANAKKESENGVS